MDLEARGREGGGFRIRRGNLFEFVLRRSGSKGARGMDRVGFGIEERRGIGHLKISTQKTHNGADLSNAQN